MDLKHRAVLLTTLFALIIRLYFFRYTQAESGQDSYWLAALAKGILHGKYEIRGDFWGAVQPLYPFLMALLKPATSDLLLSGKIISLLAGVATIPVVYLLWKKLESKEVALLGAWLVAVNITAWYYSMHVYRDSLFLFLTTSSFLLLYHARENSRWLPALAFILGLATLTRGGGYVLTISCVMAYACWKRGYLSKKLEITRQHNKILLISTATYIALTYPWHFIRTTLSVELVPYHVTQGVEYFGHLGVGWIPILSSLATLPLFILFLGGILISGKDREKYLPFYLFVTLFSFTQMWYFAGNVRYALPLSPIMLGWSSVAIFYLLSKLSQSSNVKYVVLSGIIVLSFANSAIAVAELQKSGDENEAVKDAMEWFNANTGQGEPLVAGDDTIYGYYTDRRVISYISMGGYIDALYESGLKGDYNISYPFITILMSENISYFVAYDTINKFLYDYFDNKFLAENFTTHTYTFDYHQIVRSKELGETGERPTEVKLDIHDPVSTEVKLIPLKKFERNDQSVYLYKVEWNFLLA